MADRRKSGQIDLEKELNCSICTEVLFQPLTLLDCLHTFCAACLKEWFAFQASTAKSLHPYTCPSCRASVRATRPNATVTTLLDMFIQANPGKARTEEDVREQREKYKPGDNVLPKLRLRRAPGEEEDQRLVGDVVALSLHEAGITGNALQEPRDNRRRGNGHGSRSRDSSRGPRVTRNEALQPRSGRGHGRSRDPSRDTSPLIPPRHVEHQSSLRSLMSASDLDPQEMREDILRQITEEGLLDDIDLDNLDVSQEEELSERIAHAYQQKREERLRERRQQDRPTPSSPSRPTAHASRDEIARPAERPAVTASASYGAPPVSNPHLISSANEGQRRQRRSASSSSTPSTTRIESAIGPATVPRSNSEVVSNSSATLSGPSRTRRMSHERSSTDPDRTTIVRRSQDTGSAPSTPRQLNAPSTPRSSSRQRSDSNSRPPPSPRTAAATFSVDRHVRPTNNSSPSLSTAQATTLEPTVASGLAIQNAVTSDARPTSSSSAYRHPQLFTEPSISCNRCNKSHIEYELHYNCPKCEGGRYNICLQCYRQSKGCLHWFGFGRAAQQKFERQEPPGGYPASYDTPHILSGYRYQRPRRPVVPSPTPENPSRSVTEDDPVKRLENGVFCDICSTFASACYWKCDTCNDGSWGFCNTCVNQGRHCTHPLLPLKSKASQIQNEASPPTEHLQPPHKSVPSPPLTPNSAHVEPGKVMIANQAFQPLGFNTLCDICTFPISPTLSRFHCPQCEHGDYDICTSCYLSLVSTKQISSDNGHQGWRRCPKGHRMCVIGFEDRDGGRMRKVVADFVGGCALKEDAPAPSPTRSSENMAASTAPNWSWKEHDGTWRRATAQRNAHAQQGMKDRFPPSGGVGLRVFAHWPYFPDEGAPDELLFPKGAEVREVLDINGDWFWGVYAGATGLFPGNYGQILGSF